MELVLYLKWLRHATFSKKFILKPIFSFVATETSYDYDDDDI